MVAEGDKAGGAFKLAEKVQKEHPDLDVRVSILVICNAGQPIGHRQVKATQLGVAAVEALLDDQKSMVGLKMTNCTCPMVRL